MFQGRKFPNFVFLIPRKRRPSTIQERTNDLPNISDTNLSLSREAKHLHEQTYPLTEEPQFGIDPLSGDEALIQQRSDLFQTNFDIPKIVVEVTNGQSLKFKQAILYYITTSKRLS